MSGFDFDFRPFGPLAVDIDKESKNGVWIPVQGVRFKCLRAGGSNARYQRANEMAYLETRKALQERVAEEEDTEFTPSSVEYKSAFSRMFQDKLRATFAETVVVGWDGVVDTEGERIPYSPEACLALFEEVPDLLDILVEEAGEGEKFLRDVIEEAKDTLGKS